MKIPYQPSMSKIYSRRRLRKFKPKKYNWNKNRKKKSRFIFFLAISIAAIFYIVITKSIEPIFDKICSNEARSIAIKIINDESSKAMENYTYNDLYTIEKDTYRKYSDDRCKYFCN